MTDSQNPVCDHDSGVSGNARQIWDGELIPGGTGCGIISPSQSSFGEPLNAAGGGVFGMLWDGTGIRMCE